MWVLVSTPKWVSVRTLNAGGPSGIARSSARYLRSYGFTVIRVNNADSPVEKTTIAGYATDSPEVLLVAQAFPNAVVTADGRSDHAVDVLLGPDAPLTLPGPRPFRYPARSAWLRTASRSTPATAPRAPHPDADSQTDQEEVASSLQPARQTATAGDASDSVLNPFAFVAVGDDE